MDGSDGSPPLSLGEIVRAAELFPKTATIKEDGTDTIPFNELPGESVKYLGRTDDGVLALSNYRLFLLKSSINSETSVPLGLIESVQIHNLFGLVVSCKDANTVKCSFSTAESCTEWIRRITLSIGVPDRLESLFAFPFYAWSSETLSTENDWSECRLRKCSQENIDQDFDREVRRLQFNLSTAWRIGEFNKDFQLCPSYPRFILVPKSITDDTLINVATFRSSRRIPAVVWRHAKSGAVIARCSQPEVGWLGWRNHNDEKLLKAITDACHKDRPKTRSRRNSNASDVPAAPATLSSSSSQTQVVDSNSAEVASTTATTTAEKNNVKDQPKKLLIVDARSYASAVTNRARGGGCECPEYYPCCDIEFMNLGNIHAIRKSFHSLRHLCGSQPDISNWLGCLERTVWLQHMSGLLSASMVVCHAIERQGRPVLVHCSDGWDRTPQICATAQLCLDPYYRTVEGFRILVEREWLNYGHKFADRCGHGPGSDDLNERCPVFLQWLDCVHQIHRQYPCSFEFSMGYLIKLAQHSSSCLFGTFLCNTVKVRTENTVQERTFSVWPFLSGSIYKNPLYVPNREKVLWPAYNVRDLSLWSEVYLGNLGNQNSQEGSPRNADHIVHVPKTRSEADLVTCDEENQDGMARRSSDPNMVMDSYPNPLGSYENSVDSSSERDNSPALTRNFVKDTTDKLTILTNELIQSDDEFDGVSSTSAQYKNGDNVTISVNYNNHENGNTESGAIRKNGAKYENDIAPVEYVAGVDQVEVHIHNAANGADAIFSNYNSSAKSMMQSVDINGTSYPNSPTQAQLAALPNPWLGSVDNSTDTLVPVFETTRRHISEMSDAIEVAAHSSRNNDPYNSNGGENGGAAAFFPISNDSQYDGGNSGVATNGNVAHSSSGSSIINSINGGGKARTISTGSQMDDSMLIQPEFRNLDINGDNSRNTTEQSGRKNSTTSNTGRNGYEYNPNKFNSNGSSTSPSITNSRLSTPGIQSLPQTPPCVIIENSPPVPISCPDGLAHALSEQNLRLQQLVQEHKEREKKLWQEVYTMRMLMQQRASCTECNTAKSNVTACTNDEPDDMNNENFLDELDLTDDGALFANNAFNMPQSLPSSPRFFSRNGLNEMIMMNSGGGGWMSPRGATATTLMINYDLLGSNDSNLENASVCSWEALDDGQTANAYSQNDLWVPDHAVNICTGCHMRFWLGRRKHHCRSCGQIFCADCSEYRASLPDKRLFAMVRLCASCYNNQSCVTSTSNIAPVEETIITSSVPDICQDPILPITNIYSSSSIITPTSTGTEEPETIADAMSSMDNFEETVAPVTMTTVPPSLSALTTLPPPSTSSVQPLSANHQTTTITTQYPAISAKQPIDFCSHQSLESSVNLHMGSHAHNHHPERNASTFKATTATN